MLVGAADKLAMAQGSRRVWLGNYMKTPRENHNDGFRVEAKTSAKQFLELYGSDIIIASPLGLRVAIQKEKLVSWCRSRPSFAA